MLRSRFTSLLVASAALAACGDDPETSTTSSGPSTTSSSATASSASAGGAGGSATSGGTGGGAEGTPCETAADCRIFSSACGDCACLGLHTSDPDPTCDTPGACFDDPCADKAPACDLGTKQCFVAPAPTSCDSDDDCRTFGNYCETCACDALHVSDPDPSCPSGGTVSCESDPCEFYAAACDSVEKYCVLVKP